MAPRSPPVVRGARGQGHRRHRPPPAKASHSRRSRAPRAGVDGAPATDDGFVTAPDSRQTTTQTCVRGSRDWAPATLRTLSVDWSTDIGVLALTVPPGRTSPGAPQSGPRAGGRARRARSRCNGMTGSRRPRCSDFPGDVRGQGPTLVSVRLRADGALEPGSEFLDRSPADCGAQRGGLARARARRGCGQRGLGSDLSVHGARGGLWALCARRRNLGLDLVAHLAAPLARADLGTGVAESFVPEIGRRQGAAATMTSVCPNDHVRALTPRECEARPARLWERARAASVGTLLAEADHRPAPCTARLGHPIAGGAGGMDVFGDIGASPPTECRTPPSSTGSTATGGRPPWFPGLAG